MDDVKSRWISPAQVASSPGHYMLSLANPGTHCLKRDAVASPIPISRCLIRTFLPSLLPLGWLLPTLGWLLDPCAPLPPYPLTPLLRDQQHEGDDKHHGTELLKVTVDLNQVNTRPLWRRAWLRACSGGDFQERRRVRTVKYKRGWPQRIGNLIGVWVVLPPTEYANGSVRQESEPSLTSTTTREWPAIDAIPGSMSL